MTPLANSYLGIPGYVLFWVLFAIALGLFVQRLVLLFRLLRLGRAESRSDDLRHRILGMLAIPFSQRSNLKHLSVRDLAPLGHAVMFWGLIVFALGYVIFFGLGAGLGLFPIMSGSTFERVYFSIMEIVAILILVAVIGVVVKRYVVRPLRLKREESTSEKVIQPILLAVIMAVAVLHFLLEGFGYAAGGIQYAWPPIGMALAGALQDAGISTDTLTTIFNSLWWLNYLILLAAVVYTPRSKHLHPLFIFPNVAFRNTASKGTLRPVDLTNTAAIRREDIRGLTWKQLLDSYACTWCGRCHIACPAQTSGKPLSPRELILGTKEQLLKVGPALLQAGVGADPAPAGADGGDSFGKSGSGDSFGGGDAKRAVCPPFIGNVITEEAVWACTTCRACQEVCPSYKEQMSTIVDLRRHLQMITTTETARETLKNLRVRSHPWRGTTYARTDWAEGLDVKIVGEDAQVDVLYWVGCTQALEDRSLKVAQAIALLMKEAGVNFGILGDEEMCCGDPARRLGAEHIYQMMAANNIQLLDSYGVKKIVTACPHCYNTLKNEYPELGGRFEVIHHSEFLADLVGEGRLKLGAAGASGAAGTAEDETVTYQDPCYLGRYNDIYQPARQLLQSIPGKTLVEMEKNQVNGFCCGGGGGRMWLEEDAGTRINSLRLTQAMTTGASVVATACPYCLQMLEDAARGEDAGASVAIRDVAEMLADAVLVSPALHNMEKC
jgi:Fe-S oxidoreductase